jgi:hypothetical protein
MNKKAPLRGYELSQLANSSKSNVLDKTLSEGFKPIKNATDVIDTKTAQKIASPLDVMDKVAAFRAAREAAKTSGVGKKLMGAVPFLGAGYAALQGDPAMAAEELAGDIPVAGQVYEAIKPTDSGNVEEERQMIAERNAQEDYSNSPARLARLKALQGIK